MMLGRFFVVIYFSVLDNFPSVIALARMSKEVIVLRNQFGKKWDDWAKRVPYSIFPRAGIY
jgi:protein-S-isoprenylcysteine O-methyltransferase Ste14